MAGGFQPIYQYYLDAQRTRAETQRLQTDTQLDRIKGVMDLYSLQQDMQERQIAQQIWGQQTQGQAQGAQQRPGTFDPAATGGSTPDANPSTGDDPSMQTAARMDKMAQALASVNPQKAMEWSAKASTLRDQYYTRAQKQLTMQKEQTDAIGRELSSVQPGDQAGYTDALMRLHDSGVNIRAFGLTGNLDADNATRQQLVDRSLTYAQKLEAQHRAFEEEKSTKDFAEKQRHNAADESIGWAKVGVSQSAEAFRESHDRTIENYKAKEDARASAGVGRRDEDAVRKLKDLAMRPDPGGKDGAYADSVVKADPNLSQLSNDQQKAASAEIQITARRKLADRIKGPTDELPSADDFFNEVGKAAATVSKRVTQQKREIYGIPYGATKSTLAPRGVAEGTAPPSGRRPAGTPLLPPTISSQAELATKQAGDQVSIRGKLYEVTKKGSKPDGSDTELKEMQ